MSLLLAKMFGCAILLTISCATSAASALHVPYSNDLEVQGIQSAIYNAGPLGNHAGLLSAAKAVSQLQLPKLSETVEQHDFSSADGHLESLGAAGDHLDPKNFPADYAEDHGATAEEYEEAEGAASEHHEEVAHVADFGGHEYLDKLDFHGDYHDDYHHQPVVGIDHGKGAFSYSTLYEHKHDEQKGLY
ncbi:uncharacterized protein LOC105213782 [Zeugodacus cucurbitae]|uniref:uncharacterized protein LOC105213782 n=1 Tax=Zeugodacus cucurbitae TaxID=28588 RepID=UPI0005968D0D|nr:uncharacterized protein LOC105213782 [Zeugodacus cucurbitae]